MNPREPETRPGRLDGPPRHIVDSLLDKRLTVQRALLILGLGAGAVFLYALYDARNQWSPYLWQSPALLSGLLVGLLLIAGGAALQSVQKQNQAANQSLLALMQDQAKEQRAQITELRREQQEMRRQALSEQHEHNRQNETLRRQLLEVQVSEAVCKERVEHLQRNILHLAKRRDDRMTPDQPTT